VGGAFIIYDLMEVAMMAYCNVIVAGAIITAIAQGLNH